MAGIDIRRFLNSFGMNYNRNVANFPQKNPNILPSPQPQISQSPKVANNIPQPPLQTLSAQIPENTPSTRAAFSKEVFNIPKNVNEFVYMVQRGMTQTQFNQMFANQNAAQRINLSQMQAQILAQLQGLDTSVNKEMINVQLASQVQGSLKNLEILSNGMINLNSISLLLQKNGKEGITKLIMAMTEASKSGITDLSQLKEMAKFVNASVAIASENNPQKTLKLLLLLYLPWLPLEDGVSFELGIESSSQNEDDKDSIITITVTTKNFGNVKSTLFLETSNSVQVITECCEEFPKKELEKRIKQDEKHYSMDSVITFETDNNRPLKNTSQATHINTSQTTEINPYLLLMAHTLIKHIIDIDNSTLA